VYWVQIAGQVIEKHHPFVIGYGDNGVQMLIMCKRLVHLQMLQANQDYSQNLEEPSGQ
jgi:hypothetical protein